MASARWNEFLRRRHGISSQKDFALDARQLGEEQVVAMLKRYRVIQSLVHGGECIVELAKPANPGRQRTLELRV